MDVDWSVDSITMSMLIQMLRVARRTAMSHEKSLGHTISRRNFLRGVAWTAGAAVLAACGAAVQPGGQAQVPTAASGQQPAEATAQPPADKSAGTNPATLSWEFRGIPDELTHGRPSLD